MLTTTLFVPVTTIVKRALSMFKPTAKESILAPAEANHEPGPSSSRLQTNQNPLQ